MSDKNLTYRIGADIGELRRGMEEAGTLTRRMQRDLAEMEAKQRVHRQTITDLGKGFLTFGGAAALGLAAASKAAIDWESAWAGVRKTVDGSDAEMAALEGELRKLARTLPTAHQEIAAVAEAAGALGVKRDDIAKFTKTMIDLGNTTNLTAEDAATELAKFSNIMGTSSKNVDRLGASLVALGNDGASTEKDILAMGLRIAGAGKQIGLTEAQVMGFASALSSVGIEAEAGGSSISRVMVDIEQAVRSGGQKLEAFAKVAGVSGEDFARAYREDAAGAIASFIAGLSRMQKAGGDVFGVLSDLGFKEILIRDTLLRTAGASDMLTKSLQVGTKAWSDNSALTDEANKRYETAASRLQVAWNQIKDALIDVGAAVAPVVSAIAEGVSDLVAGWQALPGPLRDVVTWTGAAMVGITLFGGAALIAVPKVIAFRESMRTLVATGGAFSGFLGRAGLALIGPWGAAISLGLTALTAFGMAQSSAASEIAQFTYEIDRQTKAMSRNTVEGLFKLLREEKVAGESSAYLRDVLRNLGLTAEDVIGAINGLPEPLRKVNEAIAGADVAKGGPLFKQWFDQQVASYKEARITSEGAAAAADKFAGSTENAGEAAAGAVGPVKDATKSASEMKTQAKEAAEALDQVVKALDSINGVTLSYREARRSYIEQLAETGETLKKNKKTLDESTAAGMENGRALDAQAKSAGDLAEAAAREAESTGGAIAGNVAFVASLKVSREQLFNTARQFYNTTEEAWAYVDSVLAIPGEASTGVLTPGSEYATAELKRVRDAVKDIPPTKVVNVGALTEEAQSKLVALGYKVEALPDGTVTVSGNTAPAYNKLNEVINAINRSVATLDVKVNYIPGRLPAVSSGPAFPGQIGNRDGNILYFAGGGTYRENHVSQIARTARGTARVWAEDPRAKWEAYITEDPRVRARSIGILDQVAGEFGFALMPAARAVPSYSSSGSGGAAAGGVAQFVGDLFLDSGEFLGVVRGEAKAVVDGEGRNIYLAGGRR